jgi:hypothetical protein
MVNEQQAEQYLNFDELIDEWVQVASEELMEERTEEEEEQKSSDDYDTYLDDSAQTMLMECFKRCNYRDERKCNMNEEGKNIKEEEEFEEEESDDEAERNARVVSENFKFNEQRGTIEDFFNFALVKWNVDLGLLEPGRFDEKFCDLEQEEVFEKLRIRAYKYDTYFPQWLQDAFKKKEWKKSNQSMFNPEKLTITQAKEEFEYCFNMWTWVIGKRKKKCYDCPGDKIRLTRFVKRQCKHDNITFPKWLWMKFFSVYNERPPECLEIIIKANQIIKERIEKNGRKKKKHMEL